MKLIDYIPLFYSHDAFTQQGKITAIHQLDSSTKHFYRKNPKQILVTIKPTNGEPSYQIGLDFNTKLDVKKCRPVSVFSTPQ